MTASSPAHPHPPFPQVATKAASTAQSSQLNALADSKVAPVRSTTHVLPSGPKSRRDAPASTQSAISDRATLSLIRKTLVADGTYGTAPRVSPAPIEGILPPLTSSNDVDVQLYAIVAIIIKDFVNSWYSKISPDHTFIDEVIQVIAHCSRAVEQRLRQIDITELILDDAAALVERHVVAYRTASMAQAALQYGESPRRIYHALNPHPALDPSMSEEDQKKYESAYRQLLIQGALAVLLPTEDLANTCLRTLVTDIIADLILGRAVADKVCEPWFLHGAVSKVVEIVTSRSTGDTVVDEKALHYEDRTSRLEKFGLLSSKAADQENNSSEQRQSSASAWIWKLLQYAFIAYQSLRFILVGVVHAQHLPRRVAHNQHLVDISTSASSSLHSQKSPAPSTRRLSDANSRSPRAVINYRLLSCISTILDLSVRMPWLASLCGFWQHVLSDGPGRYGSANSTLDKFFYYTISTRVFTPTLLPALLLQVRSILFPNNTLGPPAPPPPPPEERFAIKRKAATDILKLFPDRITKTLLTHDNEEMRIDEVEEEILGWTDDVWLNKYLIYGLLELILCKICPELKDKSPSELLAERGVVLPANVEEGELDSHLEEDKGGNSSKS
ncbi:hypothetical protein LTR84_007283 [Exophiala bonariae]|uniref:PXA domain-containing protein n=1 Tax=Exophiala bonariae TaxID=1690606 RepID=A0AAV9N283_9EURO|nr:hypothetical protein LTR84_007283 [Exophiala bonariae]